MATSNRRPSAAATSFAHLAGLGRVARADEETDDERKEREDKEQAARDDECAKKEAAGEDTGEDEDEKKEREARRKARGARADDDDPDKDGDDDSDKEEMRGSAASSRRRERARCASIFASQAAARNPVLAAHLAFNTDLSRSEARRVLRDTPAAGMAPAHRPDRAAANPDLGSGGGAPSTSPAKSQNLWNQALARVGVKVPA